MRNRSGWQVEAMSADQAEVVGEDVTIQLVAELGAECTTADATGQTTENGAGQRAEGDAQRTGNGTDSRTGLAAGKGCGCTACCATDRADQGTDLYGRMRGCDLGGITARALQ